MGKKLLTYLVSFNLILNTSVDARGSAHGKLAPKSKTQDAQFQSQTRREYIRIFLRISKKKEAKGRYALLTDPEFLKTLFTDFIYSIPPVNLDNEPQLFTSPEIEYFAHASSWPEWIKWAIYFFDLDVHFDEKYQPHISKYRWLAFYRISKEIFLHLLPIGSSIIFMIIGLSGHIWAFLFIPLSFYFYWTGFLMDRLLIYRNVIVFKNSLGISVGLGKIFFLIKEKCIQSNLSSTDILSVLLHELSHVLPGWRETNLQDFLAFSYLALIGGSDAMRVDPLSWKLGKDIAEKHYLKAHSEQDFDIPYGEAIEEVRTQLIKLGYDEFIIIPFSFLSSTASREPYCFNVALASFLYHRYNKMAVILGPERAEEEHLKGITAFRMELLKGGDPYRVRRKKRTKPAWLKEMSERPAVLPENFRKPVLFDMAA